MFLCILKFLIWPSFSLLMACLLPGSLFGFVDSCRHDRKNSGTSAGNKPKNDEKNCEESWTTRAWGLLVLVNVLLVILGTGPFAYAFLHPLAWIVIGCAYLAITTGLFVLYAKDKIPLWQANDVALFLASIYVVIHVDAWASCPSII